MQCFSVLTIAYDCSPKFQHCKTKNKTVILLNGYGKANTSCTSLASSDGSGGGGESNNFMLRTLAFSSLTEICSLAS